MKNLLAYLPALLIFFSSCATPQRCAKYCTGNDSTIITVHDTVVQVQIVADSAQATAPAPCPDTDTITAHTANATARAWVQDSTLHVDVNQQGTADVAVPAQTVDRIRYRYIHIPCPDETPYKWKMMIGLFLMGAIVAALLFIKTWR